MANRVSLGKWIDDSYRLRISAPGYDVDNVNLSKDQLVFDSSLSGYGPIYQSGTFVVNQGSYSNTLVASWPTLPTIPIINVLWTTANPVNAEEGWLIRLSMTSDDSESSGFRLRVTTSGIRLNGTVSSGFTSQFPITFAYIVKAVD